MNESEIVQRALDTIEYLEENYYEKLLDIDCDIAKPYKDFEELHQHVLKDDCFFHDSNVSDFTESVSNSIYHYYLNHVDRLLKRYGKEQTFKNKVKNLFQENGYTVLYIDLDDGVVKFEIS